MTALRGEPTVVERGAQPYVGVRGQVALDSVGEVADRIGELVGWLAERGHAVAGAPFLRYYTVDMAAGTLDLEAGVPVDAAVTGAGDVHADELPAGTYVEYRHVGHPGELVTVTGEVIDWAKSHGLPMDVTDTGAGERWDCRLEVYHSHPAEVPDPNDWETDVVLRVAGSGQPGDPHLQPLVVAELDALADLLEDASEAQWDTPSLCEGWRVREVVAHMTMPARYTEEEFAAELRACDSDFTVLSNRVASRDAELPTTELVAGLRSEVLRSWTPGIGGYAGALTHAVVHGLDVTVPLGVPRTLLPETAAAVLDGLTTGLGHAFFGVPIEGRRLRATDVDWSYGSGAELSGTAGDLVMALTGRQLPAGRLDGDPLPRPAAG